MGARTATSSRPTVDTQQPRTQNCCPTKLRRLPAYTRAMWIADFPFGNPITCPTEYFGGIEISMGTGSGIRCPSIISHPFSPRQLPKDWPQLPPDLAIHGLLPAFCDKHHMVFAFPGRVFQCFICLHCLSFRKLRAVHENQTPLRLPERSNSGSLSSKAGGFILH